MLITWAFNVVGGQLSGKEAVEESLLVCPNALCSSELLQYQHKFSCIILNLHVYF